MLRRCSFLNFSKETSSTSLRQKSGGGVPSLISMLSNRASEINLSPSQRELLLQNRKSPTRPLKNQDEEITTTKDSHELVNNNQHPATQFHQNQVTSFAAASSLSASTPTSSYVLPRNPSGIFAQLSLLKTKFYQEETTRKNLLEKYRSGLASLDIQIEEMTRFSQVVSEEEERQVKERRELLLRARYSMNRKFNRCQVATADQRRIILDAVNFLRSKHVRLSLNELSRTIVTSSSSSTSSFSSVKALAQLVEDIGFFSGALRKMKKIILYQQQLKIQKMIPPNEADDGSIEATRRIAKNVLFLENVTLVGSQTRRQIQQLLCDALKVEREIEGNMKNQNQNDTSANNDNESTTSLHAFSRPKDAIALLFSATKSGFLLSPSKLRMITDINNNNKSNRGEKNRDSVYHRFVTASLRVTEEILKTLITSFHPSLFSAWDTLQLTMWLTAVMTKMQQQPSSSSSSSSTHSLLLLYHNLYKNILLKHLWIQNASGLKGISSWLVLSCIPQLEEAFSGISHQQEQELHQRKQNESSSSSTSKLIDQVVTALIPECTKMLSAPITANQFAEPWQKQRQRSSSAEQSSSSSSPSAPKSVKGRLLRSESLNNLQDDDIFGVKPARVDSIENELSFKIGKNDPRKLMNVLSLINSDSMRELSVEIERKERQKMKRKIENNHVSENPEKLRDVSSPNKLALGSQLSLARAVIYGSLARSLRLLSNLQHHISSLPDSSLMLLIAAGPASETSSLQSRIEAAAVSNLIDSIYVQLYQICEAVIADGDDNNDNDNNEQFGVHDRNFRKNKTKKIVFTSEEEKKKIGIAIVRSLNCLAHLSRQGFLLGKRRHENGGGGGVDSGSLNLDDRSFLSDLRREGANFGRDGEIPRPKSRILSEQSGVGSTANSFSASAHSKRERRELQVMFAKDQIVARFFSALVDSGMIRSLPSVDAIDSLEKAIFALGCLTSARSKQLAQARAAMAMNGMVTTQRTTLPTTATTTTRTKPQTRQDVWVSDSAMGEMKVSNKKTAFDALRAMQHNQKRRHSL